MELLVALDILGRIDIHFLSRPVVANGFAGEETPRGEVEHTTLGNPQALCRYFSREVFWL
jgi:hypothetical protein